MSGQVDKTNNNVQSTSCASAGSNYAQVPPQCDDIEGKFGRFVEIIAALRGPNGCPWDKEQTHTSIARNMVEEAYEAKEALLEGDSDNIAEELGDVLLQVVLQAQIAKDAGEFDIARVIDEISDKMIRRHPHVFGEEASFGAAGLSASEIEHLQEIRTPGDVTYLWDYIKVREKRIKQELREKKAKEAGVELAFRSVLDDVPRSLPALMQASDISRKAVARGFEWDTNEQVWEKVYEEVGEYKEALQDSSKTHEDAELEFGDILFTLVNVARKDGIDPESALQKTCEKFRHRWAMMEKYACSENRNIESYNIEELDILWNRAKEELLSSKN